MVGSRKIRRRALAEGGVTEVVASELKGSVHVTAERIVNGSAAGGEPYQNRRPPSPPRPQCRDNVERFQVATSPAEFEQTTTMVIL